MWPFKKKENNYIPQNRLESMLIEAANNPGFRGKFMRQIFHYNLFVLGSSNGENVKFESQQIDNGGIVIYAFTSLKALSYSLQKAEREPANYIEMSANTIFEIGRANHFTIALNSGHDYGKIFSPNEINLILADQPDSVTINKGESIFLGQPKKGYPKGLQEALKKFVEENSSIKTIFLGWIVAPEMKDSPNGGEYYGAIEFVNGFDEQVFKDLHHVVSEPLDGASMVFCEAKGGIVNKEALIRIE